MPAVEMFVKDRHQTDLSRNLLMMLIVENNKSVGMFCDTDYYPILPIP